MSETPTQDEKTPGVGRWDDAEEYEQYGDPETDRWARKITGSEVDFVRSILPELPPGAKVLDCPCGPGYHANWLAREYQYNVTGIDGADEAVRFAQRTHEGPRFVHGYFQDLSDESLVPHESQDAVFSFNTSFGYLPTVAGNERHLLDMYAKVKPGGHVVIQWTYNPQVKDDAEDLASGETREEGPYLILSSADGEPVENALPPEYPLDSSDEHFRRLPVCHYVKKYKSGKSGRATKYAYYLNIKHDGNPVVRERKPVDAPVMRALARHAGLRHVAFRYQLSEDGMYHCAFVIAKPRQVDEDRACIRDAMGTIVKQ